MAKRAKRATRINSRNLPAFISQENVIDLNTFKSKNQRIDIIPRNLAQERYVDALYDDSQHVVFAIGPAGCGKTLLATQFAIRSLQEGLYEKIVITRPAVSVDEQHGFLPGGILAKMEPWMMPILDVFKQYYHPKEVQRMMENNIIEVSPLAYMRGRTFLNSFIIADEMQNSRPSQMKMVLTRIGENSRMVVTGDMQQHDGGYEDNGLKDFVRRFERSQHITICQFGETDVERHAVITEILQLYND